MSAASSRRGFLRGLTTLPLIGGGIALIGSPTATAEPVTDALLAGYAEWLSRESFLAVQELKNRDCPAFNAEDIDFNLRMIRANRLVNPLPQPTGMDFSSAGPASGRAALVLSAVGCDWRG